MSDLTRFPRFLTTGSYERQRSVAYNQFSTSHGKLALVFGCAFAAEWLIFRVVKRPVRCWKRGSANGACPARTPR